MHGPESFRGPQDWANTRSPTYNTGQTRMFRMRVTVSPFASLFMNTGKLAGCR